VAIDIGSALALGGASFLYAAVVAPALSAYSKWKNDPQREIICRRDLFGRFVPDLRRKRVERALWAFLALFWLSGCVALWGIMHNPNASYYNPQTKVYRMVVQPPQNGQ
jgi:hypothetical protein